MLMRISLRRGRPFLSQVTFSKQHSHFETWDHSEFVVVMINRQILHGKLTLLSGLRSEEQSFVQAGSSVVYKSFLCGDFSVAQNSEKSSNSVKLLQWWTYQKFYASHKYSSSVFVQVKTAKTQKIQKQKIREFALCHFCYIDNSAKIKPLLSNRWTKVDSR